MLNKLFGAIVGTRPTVRFVAGENGYFENGQYVECYRAIESQREQQIMDALRAGRISSATARQMLNNGMQLK